MCYHSTALLSVLLVLSQHFDWSLWLCYRSTCLCLCWLRTCVLCAIAYRSTFILMVLSQHFDWSLWLCYRSTCLCLCWLRTCVLCAIAYRSTFILMVLSQHFYIKGRVQGPRVGGQWEVGVGRSFLSFLCYRSTLIGVSGCAIAALAFVFAGCGLVSSVLSPIAAHLF